jgi:hypothetical protein
MALTVTAAVVDWFAPGGLTVILTASGGAPPYTATAVPTGHPEYVTRGAWGYVGAVGTTRDGDPPLNTSLTYVIRDSAGATVVSSPLTLTSDLPYLSDVTDPSTGFAVTVVSQAPNEWEARSKWWDVLGRPDPFVSVGAMRLRSGTLVLRTDTVAARGALRDLLAPGSPLLLRSPAPDVIDDVVMVVEGFTESAPLGEADLPRTYELRYQAVGRELGATRGDPLRTYTSVLLEAATYTDLSALYATYDTMRRGVPL